MSGIPRRDLRRGPRWIRGVRHRPSSFAGLLVLSALAVVVSVLTPMLLRSTQAVVLEQSVAAASYADAHLVGGALAGQGDSLRDAFVAVQQVTSAAKTPGVWSAASTGSESLDAFRWKLAAGTIVTSHFALAQRGCADLVLTVGRCPRRVAVPSPNSATPYKPPEALLPASIARQSGVGPGAVVQVNPGPDATPVTIVGVYDDARGAGAVLARPDRLAGDTDARPVPALALGIDDATRVADDWNFWSAKRLRDPVVLAEVPAIRRDLARADSATLSTSNAAVAGHVLTSIPALLDRVDADQQAAAVITGAIALEALGLAWFALASLIGRISRIRATEWGIGRTRGVPLRTWLSTVFLEPTTAVVLGAAVGWLLAAPLAAAVARAGLSPTATVDPAQPIVPIAAAAALLGSLVAIVAASVRSARLPLASLLREATEPRRLSRLALVAQVGAVLVTAIVLWVVATQRQTGVTQVALLVPVLVAIVVALGALRVAVVVVRRGTAKPTRSLAGLVVGRQIARAPSALSSAVLVTVGVALAADTLQLALVTDRLGIAQAQAAVGASEVLQVAVPTGTDLVTAVRRADPAGRAAMAAADLGGVGQVGTNRVVAVDTPRLAAITTWRVGWRGADAGTLVRRLDPAIGTDLEVRGTRLALTIADLGAGQFERLPPLTGPQAQLQAVLATGTGWVTASFGDLRAGTLSSAVPCASGCRLVSIGISDPAQQPPAPYGASFDLSAIATDTQPASTFSGWTRSAARWRERIADTSDPSFSASAGVRTVDDGVRFRLDDRSGDLEPSVEPDVGPRVLPALAAAGAKLSGFAGLDDVVFGTDLDRAPLLLHLVGRAPVLPRSLQDGVLVDLSQMQRISDPSASVATPEVWLAPGAHPAVLARLRSEGVRVLSVQRLASAIEANARRAPPRALRLSLVTASVAILLTLLGLICVRIAALPAKRRDWATLAAAGVPAARLRRLAAVDIAAPATVGAVLGVLAGVAGYLITVQRLPLEPTGVGNPPPDWTPAWGPLALLMLLAVLVIAAIGAVGSALEIRSVRR